MFHDNREAVTFEQLDDADAAATTVLFKHKSVVAR
jgi:hypothetical protein